MQVGIHVLSSPASPARHSNAEISAPHRQLAGQHKDVAEQLVFVLASFRVIRHVRSKLASRCFNAIMPAAAPSRPVERGIAWPGLLAHILVSKFADLMPHTAKASSIRRRGSRPGSRPTVGLG
jgi:transposase